MDPIENKKSGRLVEYDKYVMETLINGGKNIYQIHKQVKLKNKSTPYPTVLRSVKKLEDAELIKNIGIGLRNSKIYDLTLLGIGVTYMTKRGNIDPLEFHQSGVAQEVIKKFIEKFFEHKISELNDLLLIKALFVSPSLAENTMLLHHTVMPIVIKDPSLIQEIISKAYPSPGPIHYWHLNETSLKKRYLNYTYPMTFLAIDSKKYPNDKKIKKLLIEGVVESNKQVAIRFEDLKKNLKKHKVNKDSNKEKIPFDNFFIFLPPGGEPILACDAE